MPIILKDKECIDCGVALPQAHPATKYCEPCKEVRKQQKLKALQELKKAKDAAARKARQREVPPDALAAVPGDHWAMIYMMPRNPRLRMIEFEDGSHGTVMVRADSALRTGMRVEVRKAEKGEPHILVGQYNRYGTRVR